ELPEPEAEVADGSEALARTLDALASRHDAVVIDTPGHPDLAAREAHSLADVLITPLNDSHVDLDLIGRLEPGTRDTARPGVYAELVWKQRMMRASSGRKALTWIVMLNRVRQVDSHNTREVRSLLRNLAKRFAFDIAPGFGERTIFREMFPDGLALMDLRQEGIDRALSMSHVAARNEVRRLLDMLGVPPI
ncbi:MAG: ATPase, partial [Alphaproteobacteria bacterium]|nr:ATPase [Alphaproteobacteria bacterium]